MYTSYYGFTAKPFGLRPEQRFFFAAGVHRQALAQLRYGLSQAEGFMVLTGPAGTGKTLLARVLCEELNGDAVKIIWFDAPPLMGDELLGALANACGLAVEDTARAAVMAALRDFTQACRDDGKQLLLILDEAQYLSADALEALRILFGYHGGDTHPGLQILLLGRESLRGILGRPEAVSIRQRIVAICRLAALPADDTRAYVEHRLSRVGWDQQDPVIDARVHAAIFRYTRGIPGWINRLCDRLLLFGFLENRHEISAALVERIGKEFTQALMDVDTNANATDFGAMDADPARLGLSVATDGGVDHRRVDDVPAVSVPARDLEQQQQRIDALQQRMTDMEDVLKVLRQGIAELTKVVQRSVSAGGGGGDRSNGHEP